MKSSSALSKIAFWIVTSFRYFKHGALSTIRIIDTEHFVFDGIDRFSKVFFVLDFG